MPYWEAEDEARVWKIVEKILRQLPNDNYGTGGVWSGAAVSVSSASLDSSDPVDVTDVAVGGDLAGELPDPTVRRIQGFNVSPDEPSADGEVLTWDSEQLRYEPRTPSVTSDTIGDLGFTKELLMQDGVTAPPVPVETEAQDDWLYQD